MGERGQRLRRPDLRRQLRRWLRAAGMHYQPSPLPQELVQAVPIVMVAVPHRDASDATLFSLREAVARALGTRPGARLACVTVAPATVDASETETQRRHLALLHRWAAGLDLDGHQASFHVLESGDVAAALLAYARGNRVSIIVMGAATHGLHLQRLVATVPLKVAMDAPCTVMLVKQELPFEQLAMPATA